MSGFWTCYECGAEMYGFENCQFCGAYKGGGGRMSGITNERTKTAIDDWMAVKDGRKSRWHELFGTPERAARTLECSCHLLYGLKVDGFVACIGCPVYDKDADVDDCYYDALLEWLWGDA